MLLDRGAITQDFVACLYGTDQSVISRALRRIENLAARVLGVKRAIRVSREEAAALIFDCTEPPIQRSCRQQRCGYSGKKKCHTIKTEIALTAPGRIVSISRPAPGNVHDITRDDADRRSQKTLMPMSIAAIRGCSKIIPIPNCPTREAKRNR